MFFKPYWRLPEFQCRDCGRLIYEPVLRRLLRRGKPVWSSPPPKCPRCGSRRVGTLHY